MIPKAVSGTGEIIPDNGFQSYGRMNGFFGLALAPDASARGPFYYVVWEDWYYVSGYSEIGGRDIMIPKDPSFYYIFKILSNAMYPDINCTSTTVDRVIAAFTLDLYSGAMGFVISEFLSGGAIQSGASLIGGRLLNDS